MALTLSPGGTAGFTSAAPSNELLVGSSQGIYCVKRHQSGGEWRVEDRWLTDKHIHALAIEPESGTIFAGATPDSVHASEDGGQTWQRRDRGLTEPDIYSLACARRNGGARIYAGTEPAHLFCSDDLGHSWSELTALRSVDTSAWTFPAPPHLAHTKHITFHPNDPTTLFVSIEQGGLLKSTDGGETFSVIRGMDDDVHRTEIDPVNPERIYLTSGVGTYVTLDGGATWQHRTTPEHEIGGYPDCLVVHPRQSETVFVGASAQNPRGWVEHGTTASRISKSSDGGTTWTPLRNGLPDRLKPSFQAMVLEDWGDSFSIFGATLTGEVWASEDGGENWSEIITGIAPVAKFRHLELARMCGW